MFEKYPKIKSKFSLKNILKTHLKFLSFQNNDHFKANKTLRESLEGLEARSLPKSTRLQQHFITGHAKTQRLLLKMKFTLPCHAEDLKAVSMT